MYEPTAVEPIFKYIGLPIFIFVVVYAASPFIQLIWFIVRKLFFIDLDK